MKVKPTIICLMGPSASGKTELAMNIAQRLSCEIVSVDSAMIYNDMDIGSAKPSCEELIKAPHYLINQRDVADPYSVGDFKSDVTQVIDAILAKQRTPLLVGGTMMYFKVLQQGIAQLPSADAGVREQLTALALKSGWQVLHDRLQKIDPQAAQRIHVNDHQRLQRALEVFEITGTTLTQLWQQTQENIPYRFVNIGLQLERAILRERIAVRFQRMLDKGLVDEVRLFYARSDVTPDMPAMKSVGYHQIWQYLDGDLTYEQMQEKAITATRQLAKRQMTWLNQWPELTWFDALDSQLSEKVIQCFGG